MIKPSELREALEAIATDDFDQYITICGYVCFVHCFAPSGWRRVVFLSPNDVPIWIIYYFPDLQNKNLTSAKKSLSTYFNKGVLKALADNPDIYYCDPFDSLKFDCAPPWVDKEVTKITVPTKKQLIERLMTPTCQLVYNEAYRDFSYVLSEKSNWVINAHHQWATCTATLDVAELNPDECFVIARALNDAFTGSVDEVTTIFLPKQITFRFILSV